MSASAAGTSGGRRPPLTRRRILEAALRLVDREGASALSMRRLGRELGVEAMSLYHHVENREAVLDGLQDVMLHEIELGQDAADAEEVLRRLAHQIRGVARRHPEAFGLAGMRPPRSEYALLLAERTLAPLRAEGRSPAEAIAAQRTIDSFARGYALAEIAGFTPGLPPRTSEEAARLAHLPEAEFPSVAAIAADPAAIADDDRTFSDGVETILAGLRAQRSSR